MLTKQLRVVLGKLATGWGDSNLAELLAIKEAFLLFAASPWVNSYVLIIESDSSNAVRWILKPYDSPWKFCNIIRHIENLKSKVGSWKIQHFPRSGNNLVDKLAKDGIGIEGLAAGFLYVLMDLFSGLLAMLGPWLINSNFQKKNNNKHTYDHLVDATIKTIKYLNGPCGGCMGPHITP
ncbi:Ribonuclease H domain - like 10 [Theobroma cacao]|nr:Ribonuclease H domain - like 10 [Theobroma cacao]